jgi:hypothetical protein
MTYATPLSGGGIMSSRALRLFHPVLRWLSLALLLAAVPAQAAVFDAHWDGDWDLGTGLIDGTFVVDTLPFPLLTTHSNTNTSKAIWSGGGDSLFFDYVPGANPPPFGGFTAYQGTFKITGGTGNYAGASGNGSYLAYSIPDPKKPGSLKISVFDNGTIFIPEPSTNALLLAGAAAMVLAMRARRK